MATFDGKDALAGLVEAEYLRRGGEHFRQVVAIGDGAAWIWTMAEALYPHATHITDIYHAREHLTDLASHLAFITPDPAQWLADRSTELDAGNIEAILTAARRYPLAGIKADELDTKLGYFKRNAHRMRYQHFRDLGMFIGSGAIEGAIKAIVVQRAKQSGMHWTTDGAASIIALRCQHASGRWHELWPATTSPTGCTPPSDRHQDSDTQATAATKIIPNKAVVHPGGTGVSENCQWGEISCFQLVALQLTASTEDGCTLVAPAPTRGGH